MIRPLGEPQNAGAFWLVLLPAMLLLAGVPLSSPKAMGGGDAGFAREVGALLALGEALQAPASGLAVSPIHPELADGGGDWLRNASVRRVRSLKRRLAELERQPATLPRPDSRRRLALEADRLHWELLAFRSGSSDQRSMLEQSLARLAGAQRAEPSARPAIDVETTSPVTILRGAGL